MTARTPFADRLSATAMGRSVRGRVQRFVALSVALVACARSGSNRAIDPARLADGKYTFTERPAATSMEIQGTLIVLADTVMVDATPGPCRQLETSRGSPFVFQCADVRLTFDRRDPVTRATYLFYTTVTQKKTTCASYGTNPQGQRVCLSQTTELVDRKVTRSGTLRPHRIESPAALPPDPVV